MRSRWALVGVSAAQLAVGVVGHAVAFRRRLHYDVLVPPMRGRPESVGRDSVLFGTALSAPITMLASQAVCTVRLARGDDVLAARTLGGLGAAMTAGYLVERTGRRALTPRGADPVVTPIVVAGTGLAALMARLGLAPAPPSWAGFGLRATVRAICAIHRVLAICVASEAHPCELAPASSYRSSRVRRSSPPPTPPQATARQARRRVRLPSPRPHTAPMTTRTARR